MTKKEDLEITKTNWPVVGLCHSPHGVVVGNKRGKKTQQGHPAGPQRPAKKHWPDTAGLVDGQREAEPSSATSTRGIRRKVGEAAGGPLSSSVPPCLAWLVSALYRLRAHRSHSYEPHRSQPTFKDL